MKTPRVQRANFDELKKSTRIEIRRGEKTLLVTIRCWEMMNVGDLVWVDETAKDLRGCVNCRDLKRRNEKNHANEGGVDVMRKNAQWL